MIDLFKITTMGKKYFYESRRTFATGYKLRYDEYKRVAPGVTWQKLTFKAEKMVVKSGLLAWEIIKEESNDTSKKTIQSKI